ncbi:hypothetical protein IZU89_11480 [Cellulophaga lytica]|uniref:Uncharacterized protein n=1 Tax=Cellulophaga geojensis KL-A TaxID=1328323 RepID=A0ABN0RSL4_9FLAO|nr:MULTISPECIES: hypothetical protein [Cellulophaga]AIM61048.1 hypothetical protein IX49_11130 [Cellulophaga lytica]EWH14895.1 hypothetical protein KLA_00010 [Cellulophaga geojensis KL-A]SNQ43651.1 exported hypothetical protein [Cellulophaga lytica]
MKKNIQCFIITILLITPMISKSQLNESILFSDLNNIINEDFRKTVDSDLDNWDIEYKSDFYYEPNTSKAYTFLEYPISSASFYISENSKIKKFGLRITVSDGDEFYQRMFNQYGNSSVCSPNQYYFDKHGVSLPKEENEEAMELLSKIPMPTLEDYKDTNSITWSKIKSESLGFSVDITIYNSPIEGYNFESPQRILRILFEKECDD